MRLLVPLLFADGSWWCRRKAITRWSRRSATIDGYLAFWGRYLAADPSFCDADGMPRPCRPGTISGSSPICSSTPCSCRAARGLRAQPLARLGDRLAAPAGMACWPGRSCSSPPPASSSLPMFEVTHALVDDWYNHAVSFAAFLFGFLLLKDGSGRGAMRAAALARAGALPRRLRRLCALCLGLSGRRRGPAGSACGSRCASSMPSTNGARSSPRWASAPSISPATAAAAGR